MFTRRQYVNNECSYKDFYAQFVNQEICQLVSDHIGEVRIRLSKKAFLNDIPLDIWHKMDDSIREATKEIRVELGGGVEVCIAKAAAQTIRGF